MRFGDKYTATAEKDLIENKEKLVINDDTYAIGDIIQMLIDKIEKTRVSLL